MKDITKQRTQIVRKSNDLIQKSRFDLTVTEQKIVLYLISQVTPFDQDFTLYEFYTTDFCKIVGLDPTNGRIRQELKQAIQHIADKSWWMKLDRGEHAGSETLMRWIEKPYYDYQRGVIAIKLDNDLKPYLLELKANYTQYELIWVLKFRSKYSIRLYELIKSIHFNEMTEYSRNFKLSELKDIMGADSYKDWDHFRSRALDTAIREINKYSDKFVEYTAVKERGAVTAIQFHIQTKDIADRVELEGEIQKDLGIDPNQLALW